MVNIHCVNSQSTKTFPEGLTLQEMLPHFEFDRPYPILCAKVNNVTQGLKYRAFNSRKVEYLDYTSYAGRSVYCNSLCFLFCKAAKDVFPKCNVVLRRPISKGYYCTVDKQDGSVLNHDDLELIIARMKDLVQADIPFRRHEVMVDEAIEIFRNLGYDDKVKLLETYDRLYTSYYELDGYIDSYYHGLVPSTGYIALFEIERYADGVLLRVPNKERPNELEDKVPQEKLQDLFEERLQWHQQMGVETIGEFNKGVRSGYGVVCQR